MSPCTSDIAVGSLAILLWATGADRPALCAAPFMYASAARALDLEVEVHFAAASIELLLPGAADAIHPGRARSRPLSAFMRDAHEAGARFLGCSAAMHERGLGAADLIAEFDGVVGATAFVARSVDPAWRTLVF
ncbi:MAG: DsrE family protein [Lautropia sp.]